MPEFASAPENRPTVRSVNDADAAESNRHLRAVATRGDNGPMNLIRFAAAFFVVLGHARMIFFENYSSVNPSAIQTLFYGLTSIGHQAVVIFFVLSGYWVGGSLVRQVNRQKFTWRNYVGSRVVRLWMVLIPALLLTLLLDVIGRHWFGWMSTYRGSPVYNGLVPPAELPITAPTFFGNALFLGAIRVPTFGSNTSLWSLGYEFWMYVLAAFVVLGIFRRKRAIAIWALLFLLTTIVVGLDVLSYLPIWLAGTGVAVLRPRIERSRLIENGKLMTCLRWLLVAATFGVSLAVRGLHVSTSVSDYLVAIVCVLLLASMTTGFENRRWSMGPVGYLSGLANSSYSLYAIHAPILVLVASVWGIRLGHRWPSDPEHWIALFAITVGLVMIALLFARVFEDRTDSVRGYVRKLLRVK